MSVRKEKQRKAQQVKALNMRQVGYLDFRKRGDEPTSAHRNVEPMSRISHIQQHQNQPNLTGKPSQRR